MTSRLLIFLSLIMAIGETIYGARALADTPPRLSLPIDCEPGRTCFIQSYVDIDAGTGVRDFRCGSATYDGHKGVDFRLLSTASARRGVRVLASAPGIVKGVRDGMDDAIARENGGKDSVRNVECGNGLVIDHGDGWETQYCHLRKGSVRVKAGERVARGQPLGDVGWSGLADFAHLHLSVRKDGQVIDPFTGRGADNTCAREARGGLWDEAASQAFPYANGEIIMARFAGRPLSTFELEHDHDSAPAQADASGLVLLARLSNLLQGDRIRLDATGPAGFRAESTSEPLDRNKALYVAFAGKKRTAERWPAGRYEGLVQLIRDGAVIAERRVEQVLD